MGNHTRYLTGTLGQHTRPKIIELRQLVVTREHQPILGEITLDIFEGESVALIGTSEFDKNALLACILGQIQPTKGEIRVLGTTLPPLPAEVRRQLGVMPRIVERQMSETIAAYLQRFAAYHAVPLTAAQLSAYCSQYQLAPSTLVRDLSNLQTRVLALALALIHDPRLALLIEPLTGLTEPEQIVMQEYLQRTQREGRTLLCTFTPPLAEKHFTGYDLSVKLEQGQLLRQES